MGSKKKKGKQRKKNQVLISNVKSKKKFKSQVAAIRHEAAAHKKSVKQQNDYSRKEKRKKAERRRAISMVFPYATGQEILVLGDGNFSFSSAVAQVLKEGDGLLATSYDSEEVLHRKYPDAMPFIETLKGWGGRVLHDVDACALMQHPNVERASFDRVVFNFPHTGSGIQDTALNIAEHQQLLTSVMQQSCYALRPGGELHVTVKKGPPYDQWHVARLARDSVPSLRLKNAPDFVPSLYPDYEHRRTIGFKDGVSEANNKDIEAGAKTFMFVRLVDDADEVD